MKLRWLGIKSNPPHSLDFVTFVPKRGQPVQPPSKLPIFTKKQLALKLCCDILKQCIIIASCESTPLPPNLYSPNVVNLR
jgi:hypothetical protein